MAAFAANNKAGRMFWILVVAFRVRVGAAGYEPMCLRLECVRIGEIPGDDGPNWRTYELILSACHFDLSFTQPGQQQFFLHGKPQHNRWGSLTPCRGSSSDPEKCFGRTIVCLAEMRTPRTDYRPCSHIAAPQAV